MAPRILHIHDKATKFLEAWGGSLTLLAIRLYVGKFFWQSGQTKAANLDNTRQLFEFEYIPNWEKHHIKSFFSLEVPFPVPSSAFAAPLATWGEVALSILLVAGLCGRVAAAGIFMMALVIEMFVYPGTAEHWYWMLCMAVVVSYGSGKISIDRAIARFLDWKRWKTSEDTCRNTP